MTTSVMLALALAAGATSWPGHGEGGFILPDGPGNGWGFPNGNPDGYGYFDHGIYLPLGANRTSEYFFPRYLSVPATQMFLPQYYNAYVTRGQRYIPYTGDGGWHPAGGLPMASAIMPINPYEDAIGGGPKVKLPPFTGRVEARPINTGSSGLTP